MEQYVIKGGNPLVGEPLLRMHSERLIIFTFIIDKQHSLKVIWKTESMKIGRASCRERV